VLAPVALVHDDSNFLRETEAAFQSAGIETAVFQSSMIALAAIEDAKSVRVLVTRDNFSAACDPNGISLVLVARRRVPDLKAVFVCDGATEGLAADYGVALNESVAPEDLLKAVQELLG
jgi:hypothetical protein